MLLAGTWVAFLGCGGDGGPPAELEIGSGEIHFEAVSPGQELQLVAGSQGGYHVWLSLRTRGLRGRRMRMELATLPQGGGLESRSKVTVALEESESEPGVLERVGWPAQVRQPWCAVDFPLRIEVTLTDTGGRRAFGEMEVLPTAPEGGFGQTCETEP